MMKFSGNKKNRSQSDKSASFVSESSGGFYDPQPTEAPLHTPSSRAGNRSRRSSSLDSPIRRRENDNRTTNRDLILLMLKIILIPVLMVAGFFGLKAVVGLFDEASEQEMQQSKARTARMDKAPLAETETLPAVQASERLDVTRDFLADRMMRWEKAEQHLRAAEALERRGINDDAIIRFEQALQFAPENHEVQQRLLDLYMSSRNYDKAVLLCVRLLDQDSTQWDLKISLLRALQEQQKYDLCVFLSDQLLREQPGDNALLEIAAYSYAASGEQDKALELYKQILETMPGNLLALEGVGYIYQFQEKWLKAVPYYLKLLELNPTQQHYLALARGYAQLGEEGKALIFLGQAHSLYGSESVTPWLSSPDFDLIRKNSEFRSFVDQMVGEQERASIEEIRRRQIESEAPEGDGEFDRLKPRDLKILKPTQ